MIITDNIMLILLSHSQRLPRQVWWTKTRSQHFQVGRARVTDQQDEETSWQSIGAAVLGHSWQVSDIISLLDGYIAAVHFDLAARGWWCTKINASSHQHSSPVFWMLFMTSWLIWASIIIISKTFLVLESCHDSVHDHTPSPQLSMCTWLCDDHYPL